MTGGEAGGVSTVDPLRGFAVPAPAAVVILLLIIGTVLGIGAAGRALTRARTSRSR
ncbi:hypothetical protein Amir_1908 [Actinosynnema mirum DSM 43827]|uniref:Uncharacterized protein n=1 Tax=Actinosynnema mirum (strain ATCC 29888 / DSM 43827 / JCM 3225 / NBRC 14064 / NCIMB 13271 / NRRL B-12336 / IMRU 3971 / 101) TaxID=446462 RepID=C6WEB3_ACTMD|nr:hypothetical protein Amir_1908 [Actinosynnema mirum DSM 43827]AXX29280.1 hypothetical protein APASM_1915 [Actinosynnema pretiosum subsp. pretiosum]